MTQGTNVWIFSSLVFGICWFHSHGNLQHKTTLSNKSSLQVPLECGEKAYVLWKWLAQLDLGRDPLLASSHRTTSFQDIRGGLSREIYNLVLSSGSWTWGPALSNYWPPYLRQFSRACCTVPSHSMTGLRNALLSKAIIMLTQTWKAWTGHPRRILVAVKWGQYTAQCATWHQPLYSESKIRPKDVQCRKRMNQQNSSFQPSSLL